MQASSPLHFLFLFFFGIVLCDDNQDAKIRFYNRDLKNFTELPISDANQIFEKDWYNASRTTILFAHGFTGRPEGPAVTAVLQAYLDQNESNVALLNWQHLAAAVVPSMANSYVTWAAPNARTLGMRVGEALRNMSAAGLDLDRTHLIGHSLGAQIFGIAGNQLLEKGIQLPWITGLDPAGAGFEGRPLVSRLNPNSAGFVSVIHSDPSRYGFSRATGTVDFWPNYRVIGQVRQPGCDNGPHPMFSPEDLCNHNRSWQLLVDAVKYPGSLLGSYARNYRVWKNYSKKERNAVVLDIGKYYHYKQIFSGNYYFVTTNASPYGLGKYGL